MKEILVIGRSTAIVFACACLAASASGAEPASLVEQDWMRQAGARDPSMADPARTGTPAVPKAPDTTELLDALSQGEGSDGKAGRVPGDAVAEPAKPKQANKPATEGLIPPTPIRLPRS